MTLSRLHYGKRARGGRSLKTSRFYRERKFKLRRYRSDGELAVAGANLVAGKSAARAFRHGLGGALAAAEVCLRLIEAEPRT